MYYNTTSEQGTYLKKSRDIALKQEDRILAMFRHFDRVTLLNPWDVLHQIGDDIPITSIRRAINTLTRQGHLEKTTYKTQGPYGKPSYCWKLNVNR